MQSFVNLLIKALAGGRLFERKARITAAQAEISKLEAAHPVLRFSS